ncbi:MAG TPA: ribonuclease H-like domain-containing protein [Candidatus Bathyarchaeia archaeon]|nr:ribonuclease H-like domain-containing protein [Candidatus Bathyarchaeia archaeon]
MATIDRFARLAALRPAQDVVARYERTPAEDSPGAAVDECALARLLGATIFPTKYGNHLSIRNWYATPEFQEVAPSALDLLCQTQDAARTKKWREATTDPEKWLFLDTETTGLAGGTGTYAFLVGIAWWDSGGLQIEQFLMRDFSEEHSVLLELAARIAQRPVLVTFNGKTFDWPLLESRYLMTRCIRVPELAAHLDLLHPARAVWKLRLGSVKLVELERHVLDIERLGWHREDDVPSSMIPQFYFNYLRGGSPAPLAGVVRHNGMDLRGLAALFGKLNALLDCQQREETEALDLFGLSRYLQRRGEATKAESACVAARDRGLPLPFAAQARRELALMAKRRGEHAAAAMIWEELLQDAECCWVACEELALYHERRTKDFKKALEFARAGLQVQADRRLGAGYMRSTTAEIRRAERMRKRVTRLERRLDENDRDSELLLEAEVRRTEPHFSEDVPRGSELTKD